MLLFRKEAGGIFVFIRAGVFIRSNMVWLKNVSSNFCFYFFMSHLGQAEGTNSYYFSGVSSFSDE